jgi:hypothetical protein
MASGARRDEHRELSGACNRTKCKAFSDAYTAFNESWISANEAKVRKVPEVPQVPVNRRGELSAALVLVAIALLLIVSVVVWTLMNRKKAPARGWAELCLCTAESDPAAVRRPYGRIIGRWVRGKTRAGVSQDIDKPQILIGAVDATGRHASAIG